jgi:hypothetical protein
VVPLAIAFGAGAALTAVAVFWPRPQPTPPAVVAPPVTPVPQPRPAIPTPTPPAPVPPTSVPPPTPTPAVVIAPDAGTVAVVERPGPKSAVRQKDAYDRGIAQLARGDEREALLSFRSYLRGSGQSPARRAEAERYMLGLQRKFGEIEVRCDLSGAEVFVDGQRYGTTPLSQNIVLRAGGHELVITKPGYNTIRKPFNLAAGQRQPFFFKLPR